MTFTISDIYKSYKTDCKESGKTPLPIKTFKLYCEYANMELVNAVIFEAKEIGLAHGMGSMQVVRFNRNFEKAAVNFNETRKLKEQGINAVAYYTDDHYFSFKWIRSKCHIPYKSLWIFKASAGNANSVGGVKYILSKTLKSRPDLAVRYKYINK